MPDAPASPMVTVTVRYFAAARAAAGVETENLTLPAGATVGSLTDWLTVRNGQLGQVLQKCSYLCDGLAVRNTHVELGSNQTIDVLPPFAGG